MPDAAAGAAAAAGGVTGAGEATATAAPAHNMAASQNGDFGMAAATASAA
jgi:hypothetical protein